ncbi:MAG: hypothetical protein ACFFBH_16570 [Promethearchaeota archaeon]
MKPQCSQTIPRLVPSLDLDTHSWYIRRVFESRFLSYRKYAPRHQAVYHFQP